MRALKLHSCEAKYLDCLGHGVKQRYYKDPCTTRALRPHPYEIKDLHHREHSIEQRYYKDSSTIRALRSHFHGAKELHHEVHDLEGVIKTIAQRQHKDPSHMGRKASTARSILPCSAATKDSCTMRVKDPYAAGAKDLPHCSLSVTQHHYKGPCPSMAKYCAV